MKLYRSVVGTPYTGPGSFWSSDLRVAQKYGKHGGRLLVTDAGGRALYLSSDEELVEALQMAGVGDAEERVMDNDWLSDDVYEGLRRFGYAWIERPIDLGVSSEEMEWIYVGKPPLRWTWLSSETTC